MKIKLYQCCREELKSEYPVGLGYLKSNCDGDIEIVKDRSELCDCDLIGLSTVAHGISEAIDIVTHTKIPVVIGGQGTLWKGLRDYPFKYIVSGEGERALQEIINGTDQRYITKENIPNLDVLNFPERGKCGDVVPILTSRGCPWNCYFCSSQAYWEKPRYHSAEYFMAEVNHLQQRYDFRQLYILDDLFIANRERFEKIYELWMKARPGLELNGFVRSNLMTFNMARKLKNMGFVRVRFGAESGSDDVLQRLNKKSTVADHQRCIDVCNSVGLPVCFSVMWNTPGETEEEKRLTRLFIERNKKKATIAGNYVFRPFPGTKFFTGKDPVTTNWRTRVV